MDRFDIVIECQEQLERLIAEWGFLPFFRSGIAGFSIEEMTPRELLFGDEFNTGPWQWKGPIIGNWQTAYGKFFRGKAGYVSLDWLPDFVNWRRTLFPLNSESTDAKHILDVLQQNESMLSKQLKHASGFTLSRKHMSANENGLRGNGMAFDALIAQLQMGTYVCIADFEYQLNRQGNTYGWGVARYSTPEAMYPDIITAKMTRTPEQSRQRIINHLSNILPDVPTAKIERLIGMPH
ncbi:MAG: hypothetical protein Q4D14_05410 [Bacteroidales bacterium]|nr:hypothetical protein [Bacteroidales bacterium]